MGGVLALARELRVHEQRAASLNAQFWFTDGGDWFQGTPEGNTSKGRLVVDLQSELGLSFAVLGNHEFDFGTDNTRSLVARAAHPVLAANVRRRDGIRPPWLRPYVVRELRGIRIAIVGLITKDTKLQSTGPFGDLDFEDEVSFLARELPRIERHCDAVILLTHCGYTVDRELARRFPSIRLILGGHSHTSLKEAVRVGETTIVQTGGKASEYYVIDLAVDEAHRSLRVLRASNRRLEPRAEDRDQDIARWIEDRSRGVAAEWDSPVGRLAVGLAGSRGVTGSTTAGNLLADLIREAGGARIGIMNRGGIRASLEAGVVTKRDVFELLPFENDVVSMNLDGAAIRAVLSEGLATAQRPFEVSGIEYEVVRDGDAVKVGALRLVPEGVAVDERREYRVATNSFLAAGGDGARTFLTGQQRVKHEGLLRDLLLRALDRRGKDGDYVPLDVPSATRIVVR